MRFISLFVMVLLHSSLGLAKVSLAHQMGSQQSSHWIQIQQSAEELQQSYRRSFTQATTCDAMVILFYPEDPQSNFNACIGIENFDLTNSTICLAHTTTMLAYVLCMKELPPVAEASQIPANIEQAGRCFYNTSILGELVCYMRDATPRSIEELEGVIQERYNLDFDLETPEFTGQPQNDPAAETVEEFDA